jgi:hypothetical protein
MGRLAVGLFLVGALLHTGLLVAQVAAESLSLFPRATATSSTARPGPPRWLIFWP